MSFLEQVTPNGLIDDVNDNFEKIELLQLGGAVRIFFVDNVNGDADNDGSMNAPFAEVSQAITAWEAWRAVRANVYGRGAILVRGTGVAYAALTALPSYCDIVGLGAEASGNGTGIVIIGDDGADGIAGIARGLGLYNLQIRSGGAFWCCDFVNLFRSVIKHCAFQAFTHATDGGIRFSDNSGGVIIEDCHWSASGLIDHKVGISALGANFDHMKIRRNFISGTVAGILIDAATIKADHSIIEDNYIGDSGGYGCAKAIDDNATAGTILIVKNAVMGTALITCVNNGAARVHGNVSANGFVAVTAS